MNQPAIIWADEPTGDLYSETADEVECRQQIGVLRAIGCRRSMVQLSLLLEFSFVALLGTAIGVILGLILGANAISDIRSEEANQNLRLSIP